MRVLDIMFRAAAQTLLEIAADPKYLGATIVCINLPFQPLTSPGPRDPSHRASSQATPLSQQLKPFPMCPIKPPYSRTPHAPAELIR